MPVETATFVSQLVATNPVHIDGLNAADSHLRLLKNVLQAQFTNLGAAAVTGTAGQLNQAAAANATVGVMEVLNNGTIGAQVKLDPPPGSGAVISQNTGTNGNPGVWSLTINDATNANPLTPLTVTRAGTLTTTQAVNSPSLLQGGNLLVPTGIIGLWSGTSATIPAGWHLCDGTSGTPDLRDMFVVGAGGSYAVSQTGGAVSGSVTTSNDGSHAHTGATGLAGDHTPSGATDAQGSHSHGGASQAHALTLGEIPAHAHNTVIPWFSGGGGTPGYIGQGTGATGNDSWASDVQGGGAAHSHAITADGTHTHGLSINAVPAHAHSIGTDGSHQHTATLGTLPPFYALCYIMKL